MPKFYGELQEASLENKASDPSGNVSGKIWNNTTEGRVKSDDGSLKRAFLKNDQKAVIGNSGTAAENIRIHKGASELLQLVLGNDVTAEASMSTALAKLSMKIESYTAAGIPAFGNAGRLVYLTDTTSFAFDTGSAWNTIRMLRPQIAQAISTHTGLYTAAIGDGTSYNDATSAGYTITLPAGVNGEKLTFIKTDTTFNVVTIGAITTLNTVGERVTLEYNGSAWVVFDRSIPSVWTAYTPTIGAGFGSCTNISYKYRRQHDDVEVRGSHTNGTVAASTLASLTLPSGLALDSAKIGINTTISASGGSASQGFGYYFGTGPSAPYGAGTILASPVTSTTTVYFGGGIGTNISLLGGNGNQIGATGGVESVYFRVPISGWNG